MAKRVANTRGRSTKSKTSGARARGTTAASRGTSAGRSSGKKTRSTAAARSSRTAAGRSGDSAQAQSRTRRQNIRSAQRSTRRDGGGAAHPLFDHEDIRRWAEERGAVPTCVRGTGRRSDTGMIRLEFPRFGEEPKLQPINWDQWLEKFDQSGLALLVQDETGSGEKSNFNKLVKRSTVEAKAKPKVRGAH